MANTIKLKNSGTSSNTPSSLEYGELAINYADGKLFYKDGGGSISEFANARASVSDTAPSSPSEGDIWFESDTGDVFVYYDSAWIDVGGTSVANIAMSDTAPSSPVNGDFWFETDTGRTFVYYDDGTSQQWIEVGATSAAANGVDGAVQFASGGTFSSDDANLHWDDTNNRLGVGTNSPTTALDISQVNPTLTINDTDGVAGGSIASLIQFEASNTVAGEVGFGTGAGNMISWAKDGNYYTGTQSADNVFLRTSNIDRVTIDSSGNVGIGTTSPDSSLEVADGTLAQVKINDTGGTVGAGTNAKVVFDAGGSKAGHVGFNNTASGIMGLVNVDGEVRLQTNTADQILLRTNNSTRVTVTGGGDVGIGTTSPSYKLDVNGTARFQGGSDGGLRVGNWTGGSTYNGIYTGSMTGSEYMILSQGDHTYISAASGNNVYIRGSANSTSNQAIFGTSSTQFGYVIANNMNLTSSTDAALTAQGCALICGPVNSKNLAIDGNEIMARNNGSTSPLYLNADGGNVIIQSNTAARVGIGTSTPTYMLDLSGGSIHLDSARGIYWSNGDSLIYNDSSNEYQFTGDGSTDIVCDGEVRGSSKLFRISHPLPELTETTDLAHMSVEAPSADLLYRGSVTLVNGQAVVDIDEAAGMTAGTFVAFTRNVQCFTSNETGWSAIRGAVSGSTFTIEAQDETCTDTISWMVVAQRKDAAIISSSSTDDEGYVVVEPPSQIWSRDLEPEAN